MLNKCIVFILIFVFLISPMVLAENTGDIIIKITKLKSNKGLVLGDLFKSKQGFPTKHKKAYMTTNALIKKNKSQLIFKNVPYGSYAISVVHDENKNYKLDKNIMGIPKEGVGVSNNVKPKFGPPSFKASMFDMQQASLEMEIKVKYIFSSKNKP